MKSLYVICLFMVFCGMTVSVVKDYFYVSQAMKWAAAQNYCTQNHGNLASITTEEENKRAVTVSGSYFNFAWIGLSRTAANVNSWMWVDGEAVTFTFGLLGEPNGALTGENCVLMYGNRWIHMNCNGSFYSICSRRFALVNMKSTWDEALKHCRKDYTDLAFVDSGTLLDLLKTEADQAQTTSVWIGLHFLDGQWFWVNGMPLGSLVSLSSCPAWPYRCGAYNFNTDTWENRDCNDELNFLCNF